MGQDVSPLIWTLILANTAGILVCGFWVWQLRRRFKAALGSLDDKKSLAHTLTTYFDRLGVTAKTLENLKTSYKHLADIGARSIQKIGMVRFNPFRDTGGDQSFVLALLDNQDTGFLLTSIHGREGTRVYIKPIAYGASKYQLSDEETRAIKSALGKPGRSDG